MEKATLRQRDKFWKLVQEKGTPVGQMQSALASGLFSDTLDANFNEPINRVAIRRILGLKPDMHVSMANPIDELLDRCQDVRLHRILTEQTSRMTIRTIGCFVADIGLNGNIFRWKGFGKWSFVNLHDLLLEDFAIDLCAHLSRNDKWILEHQIASQLGALWKSLHPTRGVAVEGAEI